MLMNGKAIIEDSAAKLAFTTWVHLLTFNPANPCYTRATLHPPNQPLTSIRQSPPSAADRSACAPLDFAGRLGMRPTFDAASSRFAALAPSKLGLQHGSIAPDGGQIIGQSTENQPVRSRKHIHSHFDLKIAIFSTALVLGNRSMCLFLLYNAGAQIFQSPQDFALREDVRKSVISHPLNSTAAGSDTCLFRVRSPAQ